MNPFRKLFDIRDVEDKVEGKSLSTIRKKQKALEHSINEGATASFAQGIGEHFITPFAVAIKSNPLQIGFLSSLHGLLTPLAQIIGSNLMSHNTRKKLVLRFVLLQSLTWLTITALAILFWKNIFADYLPYMLIFLYATVGFLGGLAYPAWFSWMGDIVPEKDRRRYFSKRNRVTGAIAISSVLIGSFLLDAFRTKGFLFLGFASLFTLAFFFRFTSYKIFKKQYSPSLKLKKGDYFSLISFLKRFDNYGKFSVYNAFFYFSLMIASPFFAVYLLQELGLESNYVLYVTVIMSSSVFYLLFTPLVGRFSDRFGNLKLLYLANISFAVTPLFWIFIKNIYLLILIPQLIAGLANAAYIIASTNFTYDSASQRHRGICIAYTNILAGVGTFLGSILGGLLLSNYHLPESLINPFFFVFIVSSAGRFLVGLIFLPKIKEEKMVERLPPMSINLAHPFRTLSAEIGWFRKITR